MNRYAITALLAAVFIAPAHADETQTEKPETSATQQVAKEDRLICKSESIMGTRQKKRVCRTADEVRAHREAGKAYTKDGHSRLQDVTGEG